MTVTTESSLDPVKTVEILQTITAELADMYCERSAVVAGEPFRVGDVAVLHFERDTATVWKGDRDIAVPPPVVGQASTAAVAP